MAPVAETRTRRGTQANRDVQVQAQVQDAQQPKRAMRIRVAVEVVTNCNSTLHIARFCNRVKCYKCGLSGHIAKKCATDAGENKPKEGDVKGERRAEGAGSEDKLRACVKVTTVRLTSQLTAQNAWIVDSGASQHITNRKNWLSDFYEWR